MRLLFVALAACSAASQQISIAPPPPKESSGQFVGGLCAGESSCKCRDVNAAEDGGVGVPDPNSAMKRFEFRLGPTAQGLWATVHGTTMYKTVERPEECWYVDLPTGEQDIELRASEPSGVSAAWTIRELGAQTKSWYDTLAFNCGSPGVCSFDELDATKDDFAKQRIRDLCGSTKVKGITWDTGKAPDQLHPSELAVHVHLEIYKRVPDRPHGDPLCGKRDAPPVVPNAPADPLP